MKRRIVSRPGATRRPSAAAEKVRERSRRKVAAISRRKGRDPETIPADRGAREQESLSQGSE